MNAYDVYEQLRAEVLGLKFPKTIITGGRRSGKTTALRALARHVAETGRHVTILLPNKQQVQYEQGRWEETPYIFIDVIHGHRGNKKPDLYLIDDLDITLQGGWDWFINNDFHKNVPFIATMTPLPVEMSELKPPYWFQQIRKWRRMKLNPNVNLVQNYDMYGSENYITQVIGEFIIKWENS